VKFVWRGETFEAIDQEDLSWSEAEDLEEATGYTSTEIGEDKRISGKARVVAAQFWLAVRRQNDKVEFGEFLGSKLGEFQPQTEDQEETAAPPPAVEGDPLDEAAGSGSETSGGST
jgi:hypothetical protein